MPCLHAVLASMLVVPHTPIVQHAAAALSALSVDPPAKLAVMLHAGEALAGLLKGVAAEQVCWAAVPGEGGHWHLSAGILLHAFSC